VLAFLKAHAYAAADAAAQAWLDGADLGQRRLALIETLRSRIRAQRDRSARPGARRPSDVARRTCHMLPV
jgi:hypothetical protein